VQARVRCFDLVQCALCLLQITRMLVPHRADLLFDLCREFAKPLLYITAAYGVKRTIAVSQFRLVKRIRALTSVRAAISIACESRARFSSASSDACACASLVARLHCSSVAC
jgi:hypothetical protein